MLTGMYCCSRREEWRGLLDSLEDYPQHMYHGRGIIIPAGGRLLEAALVTGLSMENVLEAQICIGGIAVVLTCISL